VVTTDVGRTCQAGHGVQVPRIAQQRSNPRDGWAAASERCSAGALTVARGNDVEWLCVVERGRWNVDGVDGILRRRVSVKAVSESVDGLCPMACTAARVLDGDQPSCVRTNTDFNPRRML
jgi:hypothetical protein